jgi:hypothetical protein
MKTKYYTRWIKLSRMKDKNCLSLTITCEYAISYKILRHTGCVTLEQATSEVLDVGCKRSNMIILRLHIQNVSFLANFKENTMVNWKIHISI